jgi:phosphatidylinositol-3-phosphatase
MGRVKRGESAMWRRISVGLAVIAGASAVAGGALAATGVSARTHAGRARVAGTSGLCGLTTTAPKIKHVVVIFMENYSYESIMDSTSTPYIHSLASSCGLATNYHNITHPSLPEYIAATTGASLTQLTPFLPDCTPSATCEWTQNDIFDQLNVQGRAWKGYAESMPGNCSKSNSGLYAPRHNPAVYDTDLTNCAQRDVPLGKTSDSPLLKNFSSEKTAPAFAWITPNLCDDMHGISGCPSNLLKTGDTWLSQWIPKLTSTAVYKKHDTVIFLTWDEGEGGSYATGENCATHTTDQSCHVVMIVIGPSVKKGKKVGTLFNHYSLLKSAETLLGLPKLGQAASAASMIKPFNL